MDIKELNKLAKACRKLGITHLKTSEVEIFLDAPVIKARPRGRNASPTNEALFNEPDAFKQQQQAITETDLLFWSTPNAGEHIA